MKPVASETFDLEDEREFTCPFCGKRALFGKVAHQAPTCRQAGQVSDKLHVVLHDEPSCERFLSSEPLTYLYEVHAFMTRGVN